MVCGKKSTGLDTYEVYVDSDHLGNRHRSRKSHSGLLVFLNGVLVAWRSKKQKSKNTALSPEESEIYALSEGTKEARNVAWVLQKMGSSFEMPMEAYDILIQLTDIIDNRRCRLVLVISCTSESISGAHISVIFKYWSI